MQNEVFLRAKVWLSKAGHAKHSIGLKKEWNKSVSVMGLGLFAAALWGCGNTGGITIDSCTLGAEGACAPGHICQATTGMPAGQGICVPKGRCTLDGAWACEQGEICWDTADTPEGMGTCMPENTCTLDNPQECAEGEICLNTPHTPEGLGTCTPAGLCTLPEGKECAEGQSCFNTTHTPEGMGTCLPKDTCTLDNPQECAEGQTCLNTTHTPEGLGTCAPAGSCTLPEGEECAQGEICFDTADMPEGMGTCMPGNTCTLNNPQECTEGEICLNTTHTPEGMGTCAPEGSCTLPEGEECAEGHSCFDTAHMPEGMGTCAPEGSCTLPEGEECAEGHSCFDTAYTPEGMGTCAPEGSCTLPEGEECAEGHICLDTAHTPDGLGSCAPEGGCILGQPEACLEGWECWHPGDTPAWQGICTPQGGRLLQWRLVQGGVEIVPLRDIGELADNPGAGWLGAAAGELELLSEGPGSGTGLQVYVGSEAASCTATQQGSIERYRWNCSLGAGFIGPGPTLVVQAQLGSGALQEKTYQAAPHAPELVLSVVGGGPNGSGLLGSTVTVCVEAEARGSAAVDSLSVGPLSVSIGSNTLAWAWEVLEENTLTRQCWRAPLPQETELGTLTVSANVVVTDTARNTASSEQTAQLVLTRVMLHASTGISGAVMPLAWTDKYVVVGSSTQSQGQVYFFDSEESRLENENPPEVGPLTGLASLGNSGRVAISTAGDMARTSLVDSSGNFVYGAGMDCRRGSGASGGMGENVSFPHGLTLLSIGNIEDGSGNWRFAVPVNTPSQGSILAYTPHGGSVANNCHPSGPLSSTVIAHFVGMDNALEVMTVSGTDPIAVRRWAYNPATSLWADTLESTGGIASPIYNTIGLAASFASGTYHFWLTAAWANNDRSGFDVMRGRMEDGTTAFVATLESTGAVALDESGRAYVVVQPRDSALHELHRYAPYASGTAAPLTSVALPQTSAATPVGSPILGEPLSGNLADAELYVVTTDGTVYAFNADTFAHLWTQPLLTASGQPIAVASTAQPVLKGNQLWVMSEGGELYSVLVSSNGLSRLAQWPTMHRDNCNSSSRYSTFGRLPSCF
ncbi:MAG: hypothetical protein FWG75_07895 [Cystobacterineae bacterium]|nr:hypothetical protein [Cystobacterineae bacterium]